MVTIVAVFGAAIALLGIAGIVRPDVFREIFARRLSAQSTWILAVVLRLGIGTLLLMAAGQLRFPTVMTVLGWLSIAAAIIVLLMGPERLERLVSYWLQKSDGILRVGAVVAAAFGAFLLYVATPASLL
jgi:multisubunit Na+/H+ antiporter MnhG subunit